jgi:hypothetical protein
MMQVKEESHDERRSLRKPNNVHVTIIPKLSR